jgi:hypothetical protein
MSLDLNLVVADSIVGGGDQKESKKKDKKATTKTQEKSKLVLACRCAQFVADHFESRALHFQLLRLSEAEDKRVQTMYLHVCQQLLLCIRDTASQAASNAGRITTTTTSAGGASAAAGPASSSALLAEVGLSLERVLFNLQGLLSVAGFIAVVQELLSDDDARVRAKALELLARRVHDMKRSSSSEGSEEAGSSGITKDEAALFLDMLPDLSSALAVTGVDDDDDEDESEDDEDDEEDSTTNKRKKDDAKEKEGGGDEEEEEEEDDDFLASALCAVDILARSFAPTHPDAFLPVLGQVVRLLQKQQKKREKRAQQRQEQKKLAKLSASSKKKSKKEKDKVVEAFVDNGDAAASDEEEEEEGGGFLVGAVPSAAFLSVATMCGVLGTRAFPHLPKLMPLALNHLQALNNMSSASSGVLSASLCAVLSALVAAAQSLPHFVHPYLSTILSTTHQGHLLRSLDAIGGGASASSALALSGGGDGVVSGGAGVGAGVGLLVQRLHQSVAKGVPLRLLLPILLRTYEAAVADVGRWGLVGLQSLVGVFQSAVQSASQKDVKQHLEHLTLFLVVALSFREGRAAATASEGGEGEEEEGRLVDGVEEAVVEALVCVVLRMNENELAAFFVDHLYEWKQRASDQDQDQDQDQEEADQGAASLPSSSSSLSLLARRATFFHVTCVLAESLKSIFVPYFEHFFDDCCNELSAPFKALNNGDEDEKTLKASAKKKRKLAKGASGSGGDQDTVLASATFASLSPSTSALQWRLLKSVVASLQHCFEHDNASANSSSLASSFMTKERVEAVTGPLVRHLALAPLDSKNKNSGEASSSSSSRYVLDEVAPCVAQLAVAAGSDLLWKPLNHQVLLSTRDSSPSVRLAALHALHNCFEMVGEEYLVMLPESLSFLSELLEDSDPTVEAKCREILKFVEGLSGEDLDTYL